MPPRPLNASERHMLAMVEVCSAGRVEIAGVRDDEWRDLRPCSVKHCFLYRLFGADGELIYVGITTWVLGVRWQTHRRKRDWWSEIAYAWIECYPSGWIALIAEREAIMREGPRCNVRSAVNR